MGPWGPGFAAQLPHSLPHGGNPEPFWRTRRELGRAERSERGWPPSAGVPWKAERSERSEAGLGSTKEVLGFVIDFDFNLDLLFFY